MGEATFARAFLTLYEQIPLKNPSTQYLKLRYLNKFNKGKSSWCIPKKDSKEYEKVMKIMRGLK